MRANGGQDVGGAVRRWQLKMCSGFYHDGWGVSVKDGIATISRDGEAKLTMHVLLLAKLFREGMAQHRRESGPEELARQWEDLCAQPKPLREGTVSWGPLG